MSAGSPSAYRWPHYSFSPDTGASISLMDYEIYLSICQESHQDALKNTDSIVCGLGGKHLEIVGKIDLLITNVGLVTFTVVKNLNYPAILGADQLQKGHAKFDFENNHLVWHGSSFELFSCPDSPVSGEISMTFSTGNSKIDELLKEFSGIVYHPDRKLPACPLTECEIPTTSRPIRQRAYRTPLSKRKVISQQVDDMLEQGIIRESSSPWASPITLVPKKSGELRFLHRSPQIECCNG